MNLRSNMFPPTLCHHFIEVAAKVDTGNASADGSVAKCFYDKIRKYYYTTFQLLSNNFNKMTASSWSTTCTIFFFYTIGSFFQRKNEKNCHENGTYLIFQNISKHLSYSIVLNVLKNLYTEHKTEMTEKKQFKLLSDSTIIYVTIPKGNTKVCLRKENYSFDSMKETK